MARDNSQWGGDYYINFVPTAAANSRPPTGDLYRTSIEAQVLKQAEQNNKGLPNYNTFKLILSKTDDCTAPPLLNEIQQKDLLKHIQLLTKDKDKANFAPMTNSGFKKLEAGQLNILEDFWDAFENKSTAKNIYNEFTARYHTILAQRKQISKLYKLLYKANKNKAILKE